MRHTILSLILLGLPMAASAETKVLDLAALEWNTVHEEGLATVIVGAESGPPSLALVRIADGSELAPHSGGPVLRFVTVISGTLSYADGDTFDASKLVDYPAGTVLMLPPDTLHFAAARNGDVLLQALVIPAQGPVAKVAEQLE